MVCKNIPLRVNENYLFLSADQKVPREGTSLYLLEDEFISV
jgi:hypothetical protein